MLSSSMGKPRNPASHKLTLPNTARKVGHRCHSSFFARAVRKRLFRFRTFPVRRLFVAFYLFGDLKIVAPIRGRHDGDLQAGGKYRALFSYLGGTKRKSALFPNRLDKRFAATRSAFGFDENFLAMRGAGNARQAPVFYFVFVFPRHRRQNLYFIIFFHHPALFRVHQTTAARREKDLFFPPF